MVNHYDILGVDRKARLAEIKRAYRRLARKFHPDLNPGDKRAEERFKQISEAYDVLSDSEKRKKHDRELQFGQGFAAGPEGAPFWGVPGQDPGFDFGDLSGADSGFSAFFSEIFGCGTPRVSRTRRRGAARM